MKICDECHGIALPGVRACPDCGADLAGVDRRSGVDLIGAVVSRKYQLVEFVGEGSMGWVYRGLHLSLDSTVAVKLMKPSGESGDSREERFVREARAASLLNHPHIISVLDFGRTAGGLLFLITEFLHGVSLSRLLAQVGPLPAPRLLNILRQILDAIEEAHSCGVVHRDLKPENIVITQLRDGEDHAKVLDFGIAHLTGRSQKRLTQAGQIVGTPTYMAPEQIRQQPATAASDLYACGILLYEMLTGRPPFEGDSIVDILTSQLHDEPLRLGDTLPERDFPEELETVIRRALAKPSADRFQTAAAFRAAVTASLGEMLRQTVPCRHCGARVGIDAKFCPECGGALAGELVPRSGTDSRIKEATPASRLDPLERAASDASLAKRRNMPSFMTTLERRLRLERTLEFQLVGREAEVVELERFLEGDDHLLEIIGPPGYGKSALLSALANLAMNRGDTVITTGSEPSRSRLPWYPVRQLVAQVMDLATLAPTIEDLYQQALNVGLDAADVPGLAWLLGLDPTPEPPEFAVRVRETRAAVRRALLHSIPAREGLVVIVDDVDELDGASLGFMRDCCGRLAGSALKVVLAGQTSIMPSSLSRVTLTPSALNLAGIEVLIGFADLRRTDSWPPASELIAEASQGRPLHVIQAIRLLAEGGSEVGENVVDILAMRIGRLPRDSLQLLQLVCALGDTAAVEEVRALFGEEGDWDDAYTLLIRRGFLLPDHDRELVVAHPLIVDAVHSVMPADSRRLLHQRILERFVRARDDSLTVARHAYEARLGEESLAILAQAAREAERWLDDAGAALHYQRALQVARWELLLEPSDPRCLELSLHLADALRYSGDLTGADVVIRDALGVTSDHHEHRARLLRSRARLELARGLTTEAATAMRQAVGEAIRAGDPDLLTDLYLELSSVLALQSGREESAAELEEGVFLISAGVESMASSGPAGFWRLLAAVAEHRAGEGRCDTALGMLYQALDHARSHESLLGQARCSFELGRLLDRLSRDSEAEKHYRSAESVFERLGDRRSLAECLLARAARSSEDQVTLVHQAINLFQQIEWSEGLRAAHELLSLSA